MSPRSAPARAVAVRVLQRVAEDDAWAAPALDAEIRRAKLDGRDAGLATEIVYGTLRALPALDARLGAHLARGLSSLDGAVRATLRAGAYQLLHLGRVPAHATVSESVTIVRDARGERLAGLVNAVLRKIAATRPEAPEPPPAQDVPAWLHDALALSLGEPRMRAFLSQRALPPPVALRVEVAARRAELAAELRETLPRAEVREGALAPGALLVRGAGDPRRLAPVARGDASVQEEGAQVISLLLSARPGERVADVCAGHGGKTLPLLRAVGATGHVTAVDLFDEKLGRIAQDAARVGLDTARLRTMAVDLSVGTGGLGEATFDRVLVDAPCTGLGTIHRRPELLLRLGAGDPERMAGLQTRILANATKLARPGGRVVYAVCSFSLAEGEGVVRQALDAGIVALDDAPLALGAVSRDPDGLVRLGPWSVEGGDGPDAYTVAVLRRT